MFIKRSVAPIHWILGASLVLAACATVPPAEYPPDHPANPAAPAAAAMPTSNALTRYRSFADEALPETEPTPSAGQGTGPQPEQPNDEGAHEHHH